MKDKVLIHQRNKAVERVFVKYPEVTKEKPEIIAAVESFTKNNTRVGELLAEVAHPRSVIYSPKHDQLRKMRVAVVRMSGLGVIIATRQGDEPKVQMYKEYKQNAWKGTAWQMCQNALQVAAAL